jgi:hypothetical protein
LYFRTFFLFRYRFCVFESGKVGVGEVTVVLDDTSTWTLTADTWITTLEGDVANVNANGHTLYVNGTAVN